jgi:hypothetical protein
MAVQGRKEEWIALGMVIGSIVLVGMIFLARDFLTYRGPVSGSGGPGVVTGVSSPVEVEGEASQETSAEDRLEASSANAPGGEEDEPEDDWRADLARGMELSGEQSEILEMISPGGPDETPQAADLRERTLKEFFTEAQRKKIEDRLKRFSVEGYREELRGRGSSASDQSP